MVYLNLYKLIQYDKREPVAAIPIDSQFIKGYICCFIENKCEVLPCAVCGGRGEIVLSDYMDVVCSLECSCGAVPKDLNKATELVLQSMKLIDTDKKFVFKLDIDRVPFNEFD